jgi:hypothetical protein
MGLSETILAAMIGAAATLGTAIFQLFLAFRNRIKADTKPRKNTGMRSLLSVFVIMLGAAVAGFAFSELRSERARESTLALQQKLTHQLDRLEQLRTRPGDSAVMLAGRSGGPGRSEAMVQVAACRSHVPTFGSDPAGCDPGHANRLALCASVPARAGVLDVLMYARVAGSENEWEDNRVATNEEIDGARFFDRTWEVDQGEDTKGVCANFSQWNSERGHVARIVVLYTLEQSRVVSPEREVPGAKQAAALAQP